MEAEKAQKETVLGGLFLSFYFHFIEGRGNYRQGESERGGYLGHGLGE